MILEIRAGTGGSEAALWAADLARMYTKYSETRGWKVKQRDARPDNLGGYKEISFRISGSSKPAGSPYQLLATEAGVHRVQRVPETESSSRIHTSTATVAVLPEPGEAPRETSDVSGLTSDVKESAPIKPSDIKFETFRSGGPGGQHTNKVETGVRVTHIPTGISFESTSERSQHQNKQVAMAMLEHKIKEEMAKRRKAKEDKMRRKQVQGAKRAQKIRTYNFSQNRITDHRINKSWHILDRILDGELDPVVEALQKHSA